jgi:hypothetical protein
MGIMQLVGRNLLAYVWVEGAREWISFIRSGVWAYWRIGRMMVLILRRGTNEIPHRATLCFSQIDARILSIPKTYIQHNITPQECQKPDKKSHQPPYHIY